MTLQILGYTQEIQVCDRCGKSELKGTYAIDVEGEIIYLGSSCIAKRFEMTDKEVTLFISAEKNRLAKEKTAAKNKIQNEMHAALLNIDFWNDYKTYVNIETSFLNQISAL